MKHVPQDCSVLHSFWGWDPLDVFRTDTPIHRARTIAVHLGVGLGLGFIVLLKFRFCLGSI